MNELLTVLDTKYKRLEYIQSTGTQWIDTGIVYDNSKTYEIMQDIVMTENVTGSGSGWNAGSAVFNYGGKWSDGSNQTTFYINNRVQINIKINSGTSSLTEYSFKRISDGEIQTTSRGHSSLGTYSGTTGYPLFCMTDSGGTVPYALTKAKIYASQIKIDGVIVRNFIPVLRKSDNEIGMLDLVEGKFYHNAGTGKFTANLDTMYALIQGTPTVQDGRVSGFNRIDYIKLSQHVSFNDNLVFKTKFRINGNETIQSQVIIGTNNVGLFGIWYRTVTKHILVVLGTSINSFNILNIEGITELENNRDYYIIVEFINNHCTLKLSTDNINYTTEINTDYSGVVNNGNPITITYGTRVYAQSQLNLDGTIDLNRSYIKIDDTKYKLQAVVGYSQPSGSSVTITNGVASGFSSTNYLEIKQPLNLSLTSIHRRYIRFKTPSTYADSFKHHPITSVQTNGTYKIVDDVYEYNSKFHLNIKAWDNNNTYTIGDFYNIDLLPDTWYRLEVIGNNGIWIAILYDDNSNILNQKQKIDLNFNNSYTQFLYLGYPSSNNLTINSIDLNNTYIKINNKLWFNGLPNN